MLEMTEKTFGQSTGKVSTRSRLFGSNVIEFICFHYINGSKSLVQPEETQAGTSLSIHPLLTAGRRKVPGCVDVFIVNLHILKSKHFGGIWCRLKKQPAKNDQHLLLNSLDLFPWTTFTIFLFVSAYRFKFFRRVLFANHQKQWWFHRSFLSTPNDSIIFVSALPAKEYNLLFMKTQKTFCKNADCIFLSGIVSILKCCQLQKNQINCKTQIKKPSF